MQKVIVLSCLCVWAAACGGCSDEPKVAGRWYAPSQVELGGKVYAEHCAECHGENARGTLNWKEPLPDGSYPPPPLDGSAHAWHHPLSVLKKTIDEGGIPLGGKMLGFRDKLGEEEKLAVISYFQSFWTDEIYQAWLKRGGLE